MALLLAWVTFPGGWRVSVGLDSCRVCRRCCLPSSCGRAIAREGRARASDFALILSVLAIAVQLVPMPASLLRAVDPHARRRCAPSLWLLARRLRRQHAAFPSASCRATRSRRSAYSARSRSSSGPAARSAKRVEPAGSFAASRSSGSSASLAAIVQRVAEHGASLWNLAPARRRRAAVRPVRQPQSLCDVGHHGLPAGIRISARARSGTTAAAARAASGGGASSSSDRCGSGLSSSVCVMTLALLISTSRSGLIGLMGAMARQRVASQKPAREPRVRRWTIFQGVLLVLVAISFANFDSLVARFDETLQPSAAGRGRAAIWADARRLIADFPITGTGAGTFGTAIAVYQTAEPGYSIGQAHNHYLQLAAEGGVLVAAPAALAAGALFALFWSRLKEDGSRRLSDQGGRRGGLAGVLVQSFWETGLRMPANAMLFAVLAALAIHSLRARRQRPTDAASRLRSRRRRRRFPGRRFSTRRRSVLGRDAIQRPASPMPDFDAVSAADAKRVWKVDHRDAELVARPRALRAGPDRSALPARAAVSLGSVVPHLAHSHGGRLGAVPEPGLARSLRLLHAGGRHRSRARAARSRTRFDSTSSSTISF